MYHYFTFLSFRWQIFIVDDDIWFQSLHIAWIPFEYRIGVKCTSYFFYCIWCGNSQHFPRYLKSHFGLSQRKNSKHLITTGFNSFIHISISVCCLTLPHCHTSKRSYVLYRVLSIACKKKLKCWQTKWRNKNVWRKILHSKFVPYRIAIVFLIFVPSVRVWVKFVYYRAIINQSKSGASQFIFMNTCKFQIHSCFVHYFFSSFFFLLRLV